MGEHSWGEEIFKETIGEYTLIRSANHCYDNRRNIASNWEEIRIEWYQEGEPYDYKEVYLIEDDATKFLKKYVKASEKKKKKLMAKAIEDH